MFKQRVITAHRKLACRLDVIVKRPEILDRIERRHFALIFLPAFVFVIAIEPQSPLVLKRMFDEQLRGQRLRFVVSFVVGSFG